MDEKKLYENRASLSQEQVTALDCTDMECCHEELVFAMKDKYHEFSLALSTMLECLAVAEAEGYVPHLPDSWWLDVRQ